jgi:hypothetical protein
MLGSARGGNNSIAVAPSAQRDFIPKRDFIPS